MSSESLVIIPTYNEAHNISRLIKQLLQVDEPVDVLVVDDGSPDGTAKIVSKLKDEFTDRVHLIERSGKLGLGTAYVRGFQFALKREYKYVCEMDADFSHNPQDVPKLIRQVKSGEADVAIGSRYANGISIVNWPLARLILSYSANMYARLITGLPIFDTTAGFKCIRREVLQEISVEMVPTGTPSR
ncbi:MAG: polyprenol monophosphomannose synthase [Balneolaceae bacterium]|nr:polyprenol monophosphomannose synthase [Balneolaceae bacterium]